MNFPHLAQRLFNVPLAIRPEKAEIIMAALSERLGVTHFVRPGGEMRAFFDHDDDGDVIIVDEGGRGPDKGYDVVGGVAVIPVQGTLVQRNGGMLRPYSGMMGYDGIRHNLAVALEDKAVKAIVLDVDSPGGELAGCADLAETIYAARDRKPLWAILDECACSAAYWLASATSRVTVPRTGITGSIGVIMMHVDFSRALDKEGIAVTVLSYGARKADGAEVAPLSKEARARFQADIDRAGALFVETVARNRGLKLADVRDQEATTYMGELGVNAGLADQVASPDEAFTALLREIR